MCLTSLVSSLIHIRPLIHSSHATSCRTTEDPNKPCGLSESLFLFWLTPWSDGIITDEGLPCQGVGRPILKQFPVSIVPGLPKSIRQSICKVKGFVIPGSSGRNFHR